ncbi:hypothetical protein CBER1_00133 [Cercospora berteroae]|uniref:Uncharacterized protein n=1 Tax=Cercospora berteroae TaxID=357750 RepID=A0A2S6CDJ1_9PEZI|nr:hypothetical protein CBER1_00133 [Cercospora berteroae]
MVVGSQSPCPLADANPGKKHAAQLIDRTWVPEKPFTGSMRISMYVPSNSPRAEARTGDASSSNARRQQSNQNREVADSTGEKETPQLHNEKGVPSSRVASAETQKRTISESNQKVPAQTTRELVDLTGTHATTTRITEDEWRKRIGLPPIKRVKVDLTKESDKHDPLGES